MSSTYKWNPPIFKYAFSLKGDVQAKKIGTNPTGTLIDVDYTSLTVDTKDPAQYPKGLARMDGDWRGIKGRVVAGSDWAVVRTDGVAEFNGRFTILTDEGPGPGLLINVIFSGIVDLLSAYHNETQGKREMLLQKWSKDVDSDRLLPLNLGARFELAQASEPWAAKEYPQAGFGKYVQLAQWPFIASGLATLNSGLLSTVDINILQVVQP